MKKLYKFYFNCERMGSLRGLFVSTEDEINKNIGKELYFGEVLGKHSEIYGPLEREDIRALTEDQEFIEKFEQYVGERFGYNPLHYLPENL